MGYPPLLPTDDVPVPLDDHAAERAQRRRDVALAYRLFGALHWGGLGDGHISARDPELVDHLWLGRYGVAFGAMTVDDIVLVGPDGRVVDAPGGTDSGINAAAYYIHWPIHEARPEVVAAAHTHTGYGTPFAALNRLMEPVCQEACQVVTRQALFDDPEVDIASTDGGKRIAAALGDNDVVFLRNHGVLTVGRSVGAAVGLFCVTERACEVALKAGDRAAPISIDAARVTAAMIATEQQSWHQFHWLLRSLVPDPTVVDAA
jgi:ribulose-5-phosphate 4-epimerase/fuculose-1-phosphate aldolase